MASALREKLAFRSEKRADTAETHTPSSGDDITPQQHAYDATSASSSDKGRLDHLDRPAGADLEADNAFGGQGGESYRTMTRWDTVFILMTNQIGLGFLSLPGVLRTLGLIPGIIAVVGIGCLSWYTAYELFQFFRRYPSVINVVDMAKIVGGRRFEVVIGIGLLVQVMMTSASAAVTLSIILNTLSRHAVCTVGFIGIGSIACWLGNLPRTAKFVSKTGLPCVLSAFVAAMIVIISVGIEGPAGAPEDWTRKIEIIGHPSFRDLVNACLRIAYAYSANISFVSYMAEMRDPIKDFKYSLAYKEVITISLFTVVAIIVYCLAGEYTVSPSLGSAPILPAQIAFGIILPAVLSTGLSFGHTGCKYIYVELMKGIGASSQITDNSFKSWGIWTGIVTVYWIVCFVVSNAIPIFDSILSIASATTIGWFTFGLSAIFWFYLNWDVKFDGWKKISLSAINVGLILLSLFMNAAGLWASITELMDIFADENSSVSGVFDCGNNALL
ncbi:transmembrane amino acid transporter protein-domain-containing protein [Plectosphaerella cucumerina]|jgi:hypothetical protein|uniref:Transmembrane amino acid transporter protein-domain-containing protein n=1 Tax=Plectosphaerella cucumerina TaxID=40658 RepID=A0A8K0TS56_9PEZI|nr:transmembrane amino acid transporter protein-domain-containing protein [Plectosphaerella cucumerina]